MLLNKSFHEVMDVDTGRAWRWPHLPWHAAGFIGFIVNGILEYVIVNRNSDTSMYFG